MKKKLLFLPLLALSIGALSGCTKDDLAAFQSDANSDIESLKAKDDDLQSQIDGLKDEVAGIKNQIASLKTELEAKIQEAKDDYNAKVQAAQAKIDQNKAALQTLSADLENQEARLTAELEAEIAEVDEKYADLVAGINEQLADLFEDIGDLEAQDSEFASALAAVQAEIANLKNYDTTFAAQYGAKVEEFEAAVAELNTALNNLDDALGDATSDHNADFEELLGYINALQASVTGLQTQINGLSDTIDDNYDHFDDLIDGLNVSCAYFDQSITTLTNRANSLEAQIAQEKAAVQADYNAKIDALTAQLNAKASNLQNQINELSELIDLYYDDLSETISNLTNTYTSEMNALTHRVAVLEDVPEYTVTFDLNYDFWDGTVPDNYEVTVLKGDKVDEYLPTRDGMTLTEWTYEDTGEPWSFFGYTVDRDMTLYAQWEAEEGVSHTYDYANPKVFERETLEQAGHVRYKCTDHAGGSCYLDVREKAAKVFVSNRYSMSSYIYFKGTVEQGRFYEGQKVNIQVKNGSIREVPIARLLLGSYATKVALPGDFATFYFSRDAIDYPSGSFSDFANQNALVCKADEAMLSNQFEVEMHLYDDNDKESYPELNITPLSSGALHNSDMVLIQQVTGIGSFISNILTDDAYGVVNVGENATATLKIGNFFQATHFNVGDRFNLYDADHSAYLIGYAEVLGHNLVMPVSNNYEDDLQVGFLESKIVNGVFTVNGQYLFDVPDYAEYIDGIDASPLFKDFVGLDYEANPNGIPQYIYGDTFDSNVSRTLYADYTYYPGLIFKSGFSTDFVTGEGLKVTGNFINGNTWSLCKNDKIIAYKNWDYEGPYTAISSNPTIRKIEVNGQEVDEYSGTGLVSIYLDNVPSDYLEGAIAICIYSPNSFWANSNPDYGGVDGSGRSLRNI